MHALISLIDLKIRFQSHHGREILFVVNMKRAQVVIRTGLSPISLLIRIHPVSEQEQFGPNLGRLSDLTASTTKGSIIEPNAIWQYFK